MNYSQSIADRILKYIADGRSFFSIAKFHGMPASKTIRQWTLIYPEFRQQVEEARSQRPAKYQPPKTDDPATWGIDNDQLDYSAQHYGIVEVQVKLGPGKMQQHGMRRAPDARMFDNMTPTQERAFYRIAAAYRIRTAGMGYKPTNMHRVDGGKAGNDEIAKEIDLLRDYDEWHRACRLKRLMADIVLDIAGLGKNISEIAQERGRDWRTIKKKLIAALDEYQATDSTAKMV